MAIDNFLDKADGLIKNKKCKCFVAGRPQPRCGFVDFCSCAPAKGQSSQYGYKTSTQISAIAPCHKGALHDFSLPVTTATSYVQKLVEDLEKANPERALKLRKMGMRPASPYYYARLKGDVDE
jgi:hypothetical protein